MKNNKHGIILGIISIISTLLFVGMPVGKNILEIVALIFYVIGLLLIVYFGLVKKNSKNTVIISIIYLIILLILVAFIEMQYKDFTKLAIGFVPGLLISMSGLFLTRNNKKKASIVLNIIGLVLSIISLLLVIPNGGFILK